MPDVSSRDGYPRHNIENEKINRAISKKRKIPSQKKPQQNKPKPHISIYFGFIAGTVAVEINSCLLCLKKCYRECLTHLAHDGCCLFLSRKQM